VSIRESLLALLADEDKYGYQLKNEFESLTGGVWKLNVGQIYTTLDRLVRDGLVEPVGSDGEGRFNYRLTKPGRKELTSWFETVVADAVPPRDELTIKVLLAIVTDGVDVREVIDAQRSGLLGAMRLHRRSRQAAGDQITTALLFDALVARVESDLRWLDMCEERVIAADKKGRAR
jgi:DNA-binding PadR family transcriptional regulator